MICAVHCKLLTGMYCVNMGTILIVWWTVLLNTLTFVLTQPFPLLRYDASPTINPGLPET